MSSTSTRRNFLFAGLIAGPLVASQARSLFDGESFRGWTRAGAGVWTIEDGAFVGRYDHDNRGPGYLFTEDEFEDFELELEFWVSRGGNSGVYIREPKQEWTSSGDGRPGRGKLAGYEVQINYADKTQPTGMIYGVQFPKSIVGGEDRWNRMRISCAAETTKIYVDEILVNTFEPTKRPAGAVGLQIHGGPPHDHVVKFRNITVRG